MGSVRPPPWDWISRIAPSLEDFETIADAAFRRLPKRFRQACEGLVIRIEDFPDDEVLEEFDANSEFELLGLFRGRGLAQSEGALTGQFPNMVYLYRRPILDIWAEGEETLGDLIRHVLIHEIGHHFGLSDADMERIEREAD
ncbi:metallopeptidase family protein [Rhodoblastus acidophilus]|uniref:Metallopeptidase family protein n=1 Tax=Candidatus Rhodoblastus alkanivorans TaxID=2954117 RepID=A0ABS9Z1L0_9HYPH|nr:metallopeptidase family protein [Candidatus Rhodoblastus alkanivorans]MCI4679907.1 metallopeptidase family protein [Candidatus Rhodoblastus alkanivorans]MCI4681518.1 metallopeptidase family protein [Candidatus Rhodoblastus alkanivorans]MDI4642566.1 metallopeptidase family protein [Rhodoblastus acidophilus]